MLYIREPEEIQEPMRLRVEDRLLKYGKKYQEKKIKLKETIYNDMMQDYPNCQSTFILKKQSQNVVQRLYESPHCHGNCSQIEKIVKQSSVRYPLEEIVRPMSSQNPYDKLSSQYSPQKSIQKESHSPIQGKFLETTFSQSQKIKPIRQSFSICNNNTNYHINKCQSNSIIQLSMDLFQRKRQSQF